MRKRYGLIAPLTAVALAAGLLGGCGVTGGSGDDDSIVLGMTDTVQSVDPASGYDPGSWLVFNNVFQSLLSFPKGGGGPQPEAAERCGFRDSNSRVFSCTLREGLRFSNGNELTSKDVKHSFDRTLAIDDPDGPAVMLQSLRKVSTPDELTAVFHLKKPDATFPQKIASGAGSLVDHRVYPADRLREDGDPVGSGVYTLESHDRQEAVFRTNPDYRGPAETDNSGVRMRFFEDQSKLRGALVAKEIDLAYRGLATKDLAAFDDAGRSEFDDFKVVRGTSAEVHHLVFNLDHEQTSQRAVREAVAHLLDRPALTRDVYRRTTEPLYSVVPAGVTGHNTAFFDRYGERPQRGRAAAALRSAGIEGKAELTLWSTPVRYGPDTTRELRAVAGQLNASGLFDADVRVAELDRYEKGIAAGEYGVYVKGWVPDYPDADNFTDPFFGEGNVLDNRYDAGRITAELLPRTARESRRADTVEDFGAIQDQVARDLPILPVWQGRQYAVAQKDVTGVEWTLDASTVFRFWEIGRTG
ncbi:ABC transporter substrate-binding protein [Streptomyces sp. XM4193]|uniref:ABC transporter substrate-binding protein n=1 Tax=Streptomyces sp. XM4193 TaxID=2929782 RepID=UPI001FF8E4B4|nr:ABC transporter substrate-binding protein [Streptomyces sp. XM4193]MCK1797947.1 ABC transporter substrate-binding protein [Streptomyces sp. XM4193]